MDGENAIHFTLAINMGLDAHVYCNCYEQHRLRSEPEEEWAVYVADDGGRDTRATDIDVQLAFDKWNDSACEHERGIFVGRPIGNIALVGTLRRLLQASNKPFPILLEHVLYSGTHCGDWLTVAQVKQLEQELDAAAVVKCPSATEEQYLLGFIETMRVLSICSLQLGKPITF